MNAGDPIRMCDQDGDWTGTVITENSDGWVTLRVVRAPRRMAQWEGNVMEFPPDEIIR